VTRLLWLSVAAAAALAAGCQKSEQSNPGPRGDTSAAIAPAPALSADPPAVSPQVAKQIEAAISAVTVEGTTPPPAKKAVDNSRCHVCHLNFSDEQLAVSHAKNGVGCEKCHGACDEHASDEGNVTPPQIMYPHEKIDASCKVCHPDPMERIVAGAKYCLHVLVTEEEQKKVCTDCHGAHKMAQRQVRWNKTTGEVLPQAPAPPKAAVKS